MTAPQLDLFTQSRAEKRWALANVLHAQGRSEFVVFVHATRRVERLKGSVLIANEVLAGELSEILREVKGYLD